MGYINNIHICSNCVYMQSFVDDDDYGYCNCNKDNQGVIIYGEDNVCELFKQVNYSKRTHNHAKAKNKKYRKMKNSDD